MVHRTLSILSKINRNSRKRGSVCQISFNSIQDQHILVLTLHCIEGMAFNSIQDQQRWWVIRLSPVLTIFQFYPRSTYKLCVLLFPVHFRLSILSKINDSWILIRFRFKSYLSILSKINQSHCLLQWRMNSCSFNSIQDQHQLNPRAASEVMNSFQFYPRSTRMWGSPTPGSPTNLSILFKINRKPKAADKSLYNNSFNSIQDQRKWYLEEGF